MFFKKKKEIYKDNSITLIGYNLIENTYRPQQIIEMIHAFFMYYNMSAGGYLIQRKNITLHFHKKKKRIWTKFEPLIKNSLDFLLKTAGIFIYILPVVVMVNIQTGGYSINKLTFRQILIAIGIDIVTSYLICCAVILIRIRFQEVCGKFVQIGGRVGIKKKGMYSFSGFIHIYEAHRVTKEKFLKIFFHELDHVLWGFEEKEFDFTKYYNERPHEIRAHRRGNGWKETVLASENKIASDLSY